MRIEKREAGDVTILDLQGKMTLGEGDEQLKDQINALIGQGKNKIVLNMKGVPYIDSAGLAEIFRSCGTVSRNNGNLKLLGINQRIHNLSITKLIYAIEIFDSEAEAVQSFATTPNPAA